MTTAQDFRNAALTMGKLAAEMKPADTDPHHQAKDLIRYYLRQAASQARAIAEALEKQEHPA